MSIPLDDKLEIEIIPGILEKGWDAIEEKIELVRPFAKALHIDVIDGEFVNNTTWMNPQPFKEYAKDFTLEVHLMVKDPLSYVEKFAQAGFVRFIGHIEKMSDQQAFVAKVQEVGDVLLALDGPTDVEEIIVPYEDLDGILVYTSERVGFSGPPFLAERLEKIKVIREKAPWLPIEIDGGVTDQTIYQAKTVGATRFVSTSFLFSRNPQEQYQKLLTAASKD